MSAILQKTKQFVLSEMAKNDAAHDEGHILRVVSLVQTLCRAYPEANAYRAELLAWLHDMNDDKLASNVGMGFVSAFLQSIGTTAEDIRFVSEALPYISYRKHPKLSADIPLEIRIVQDADRIDAIGAVGIARTFAYGGAKGRPLEESLAHFEKKLLLLYDLLSTSAARELGKSRLALLQDFYRQYQEETK